MINHIIYLTIYIRNLYSRIDIFVDDEKFDIDVVKKIDRKYNNFKKKYNITEEKIKDLNDIVKQLE